MKYVANPVIVDAFQICGVGDVYADGSRVVHFFGDMEPRISTVEMMSRMTPVRGDYWVIQSDGYEYLNPKEVFERKYRPHA